MNSGAHPGPLYRWTTQASPGLAAAIAVVQLGQADTDADVLFQRLGIRPVARGTAALRDLGGVDSGVVARTPDDAVVITPHAGAAVRRALTDWLDRLGFRASDDRPDPAWHPEAGDEIESAMLDALSRAASPLAVDLLLDQPRRWRALGVTRRRDAESLPPATLSAILARSAARRPLLVPATVAALGPPNIGKSTLLNTLAGRSVSIVADEPGTTRDHVGARLTLAGLAVQYIDTAGVDAAPPRTGDIDSQARHAALFAASNADLVILCADPGSSFLPASLIPASPGRPPARLLRVALRADLGAPPPAAELAVSAATGAGVEALVERVRDSIVAPDDLRGDEPWLFWDAPGAARH